MASTINSQSRRRPAESSNTSPSPASTQDTNPAAGMLQEMIREKRATSHRPRQIRDPLSRTSRSDRLDLDTREVQSSPIAASSRRERSTTITRQASGAPIKPTVQKEMGLREMQEVSEGIPPLGQGRPLIGSQQVARLQHRNFALQLEIFHRRQRNDFLEKRVEELEPVEQSYDELQKTYAALLFEFEGQKQVLDRAVAQICELEVEKDELQAILHEEQGIAPPETTAGSTKLRSDEFIPHDEGSERPDIFLPPELKARSARRRRTSRHDSSDGQRSVLSHVESKAEGSMSREQAEDSLYGVNGRRENPHHFNPSLVSLARPHSVFSDEDDEDENLDLHRVNSPPLSILSESGFSSIYGNPKDDGRAMSQVGGRKSSSLSSNQSQRSHGPLSSQRDARVKSWIEDKTRPSTPPPPPLRTKKSDRFESIGEVLEKTSSASPDAKSDDEFPQEQAAQTPVRTRESRTSREMTYPTKAAARQLRSYSSSMNQSTVGGNLPPTPDTMSTATIGAHSSTQSIITEKSLQDYGLVPSKVFTTLVNGARPGSSDTTTSCAATNGYHSEPEPQESDDEMQSVHVQQSNTLLPSTDFGNNAASPFLGGSIHPDRLLGASRHRRPSQIAQPTPLMFNGESYEGYALIQPSRTISYPAPRPARQALSPPSTNRSKSSRMSPIPPPSTSMDADDGFQTPPKPITKDQHLPSPTKSPAQQGARDSADWQSSVSQIASNNPRSTPSRLRFFRRSNSQNTQMGTKNAEIASPPRPSAPRSNSSTRAAQRPSATASEFTGKTAFHRYSRKIGFGFLKRQRSHL